MQKDSDLNRTVIIGLFIALEIILTRFCSINTPTLRIGFGFLPVAMLAIMYGPLWAGAAYAIGDVLGMMLFPTGKFFPGFTFSAFLTGVVFGLVLYKKEISYKRVFVAAAIVCLCINLFMDTYWLYLLTGDGYLVLLPERILKVVLGIPIETVLITVVWNKSLKKVF